jgi:hypothetical protein
MNTSMREAFLAIKVPLRAAFSPLFSPLLKRIEKMALRGSGVKRPDPKGWSAKLSYRTAQKLKADGFIQ